ncbi:MAG TPA: hypothetical protein DDX91_02850 [Ruminococcaceae bacterium]|nr:hypothetical protein [Oscillospiraceae bacterium]
MAKKKQTVNIPSLIITGAAVLLAVGAVIFMAATVSRSNEEARGSETEQTSVDTAFYPSSELLQSAELAAPDLLTNNYRAYQYFTQGMSYEQEPYGNKPEDGFYTCSNDTFKTFGEFSDFIRSIYTESTAAKLLSDPFGKGAVYADDNGKLGISYEFIENGRTEDSGISWENGTYTFTLTSETECDVEIVLKDKDGKDVKKKTRMISENGMWKLAEMVG